MGVFPVLVSEYQAAASARPVAAAAPARGRRWGGIFARAAAPARAQAQANPLLPVTEVSFDDALAFIERITSASGAAYRVPSEAEWEYACRAGSRGRYSFGDTIDQSLACFGASAGPVVPGSFRANAFGLYDMHGNVREWTADLWHESYDSTPLDGSPATDGHSSMRVVRGGGWSDGPAVLRSAARMRATHSIRSNLIGFRVARALG
jgi:formylglycine-generating enzyme required for sulfatase activity